MAWRLKSQNKTVLSHRMLPESFLAFSIQKICLQHRIKNYVTQNWSSIRQWPIQNVQLHTPYAAFAEKPVFRQNIIPGLLTRRHGLKWVCFFVCVWSVCPELTHRWESSVFPIHSTIFSEIHALVGCMGPLACRGNEPKSKSLYANTLHYGISNRSGWRHADACSDRWSKRQKDIQLLCRTENLRANKNKSERSNKDLKNIKRGRLKKGNGEKEKKLKIRIWEEKQKWKKKERKKDIKKEEGRNERSRKEVREQEKQGNRHNMKVENQ